MNHGMSKTRPYRIRHCMISRCYRTVHKQYKDYGGRGIRICDRWLQCFDNFWEDMEEGYADNLQIDRIDNNGNYEPGNCRWVTPKENASKRRAYARTGRIAETGYRNPKSSNRVYKGNLTELSQKSNINYYTLYERIERGWSVEKSLNTPVKKMKRKIILSNSQPL